MTHPFKVQLGDWVLSNDDRMLTAHWWVRSLEDGEYDFDVTEESTSICFRDPQKAILFKTLFC